MSAARNPRPMGAEMQTVIDLGEHRRRKYDRSITSVSIDHEGKMITVKFGMPQRPDESQGEFLRRFMLSHEATHLDGHPICEALAAMDDASVANMVAAVAFEIAERGAS